VTLTKYPESRLSAIVKSHVNSHPEGTDLFIDRDGRNFRIILNALRTGQICLPPPELWHDDDHELLEKDLAYFQLPLKIPQRPDFSRATLCRNLITKGLEQQPFIGMRFCGLDLRNMGFNGTPEQKDGYCVLFRQCDFSGCKMERTVFAQVSLTECEFGGALLSGCLFKGCRIDKCSFVGCKLAGASSHFHGCDFAGASLGKTNFTSAFFEKSNLEGVDGSSADWTRVQGVDVRRLQTQARAATGGDQANQMEKKG